MGRTFSGAWARAYAGIEGHAACELHSGASERRELTSPLPTGWMRAGGHGSLRRGQGRLVGLLVGKTLCLKLEARRGFTTGRPWVIPRELAGFRTVA